MTIRTQQTEYVFYWSGESPDWSKLAGSVDTAEIRYGSTLQASVFLRRLNTHHEFRQLLREGMPGQMNVWDMNTMIAKVAELMVKGRLKVLKRWIRAQASSSTQGGPLIEMPRRQVKERVEESEPATLPSANDNDAQAEALTAAAENGDAFCEECAKAAAAKKKAQAAQPAAEANTFTDADAQSKTLKEAAKNGTPFCEECEKAKRAA